MSDKSSAAEFRQRLLDSLELITEEEEAAIQAGIAADPDARELTDEDIAEMRPHAEFMEEFRRRGRPRQAAVKKPVTVRLDTDVLEAWRATGPGWQSRMNDALRKAVGL
ncbi:MAG: hypothetical protein RLY86_1073 [Pseudomonadota bacterium]|jgi:uncharacterized protein (DUF4415 family)